MLSTDYEFDQRIAPYRQQVARYEQALKDIVDPIGYLRRYAESQNTTINGFAATLAQDPHFIKTIARKALEE